MKQKLEKDESLSKENRDKICDAARALLEGGYSSIFIVLDDRDRDNIDRVTDKPLRSQLLSPSGRFNGVDLADLEIDQIVSVLKLDGAHFIDKKGMLFRICRNLIAQPGCWHETHLPAIGPIATLDYRPKDAPATIRVSETGSVEIAKNNNSENDTKLPRFISDFFNDQSVDLESRSIVMASLGLVRGIVLSPQDNAPSDPLVIFNKRPKQRFCYERERLRSSTLPSSAGFFVTIMIRDTIKVSDPMKGESPVEGFYLDQDSKGLLTCFVDILKIDSVRENLRDCVTFPYRDTIDQSLAEWIRCGSTTGAGNSGTGTRAARDASKSLPNSLVIKVSASGAIKIFENGMDVT